MVGDLAGDAGELLNATPHARRKARLAKRATDTAHGGAHDAAAEASAGASSVGPGCAVEGRAQARSNGCAEPSP